ncbi:MAG TPA: uroporphyrinogen-III C-methyltransferase [Bryobacteraceae bacterium]|nr:uroporphyrinogen-III C-methyltransferase [Bryobacteraceae bacterium]
MSGKVYLIGAGPGDPQLITWKGRRILEHADAVLYDHLASDALVSLAPASAERVYVGKKKSSHTYAQDEICGMLIERARRGLTVVRLKGGDPFIFGRGGEEAEALADAGIPFEIVPGVTTPLGIAAYTGVPLTHREHTSAVTFVTGHAVEAIDWNRVGLSETLVIFMGLTHFAAIARELIARGRPGDTPAMAVRWATRPDQQTIVGTLSSLPSLIEQHALKPPATIVVGEVVRLREKLGWFERLPLFGKRIVVTRAKGQAEALSARLRALGAEVIELPTIEIRPAADYTALDRAIQNLACYDWLIFTSSNGVRFFLDRLDRSAVDLRSLRARICAIGPATRAAVEALHLKVDLMGRDYVAEGLLEAFQSHDLAGKRILLPRAAVARDLVPAELTRRGAHVEVVEAYRTVIPEEAPAQAAAIFGSGRKPDCIAFTSSSTVQNFVTAAGAHSLDGVTVASIGPITSQTARSLGVQVTVEANPYSVDGLVEAILSVFPALDSEG